MIKSHPIFGDVLFYIGEYYSTIMVYRNQHSGSIYIEESVHHCGRSVTNMVDTPHFHEMLVSLRPYKVYTGFAKNHEYRNDPTVGGFWEYDMDNEKFTFIGLNDDDLLECITLDVLST